MTRLFAALLLAGFASFAAAATLVDDFEGPAGLTWSIATGTGGVVVGSSQARLSAYPSPGAGTKVFKQANDGDTLGVHFALTGAALQDMTVEAWVFCEGNDGTPKRTGYQGIVARASTSPSQHMIRLAWDPDHQEAGDTGDGWVKLQAFNGTTWDYLGINYGQFGAATQGYIVNGTTWTSGWHRFKLVLTGTTVSAYVDNMATPVVTGTLSVTLRDGRGGFYTYSDGDFAGYFDDFALEQTLPPPTDFDVLILGGSVYKDGDSDPLVADVGINGDRITAIGNLSGHTATTTINAEGRLVVPGFIDVHSHADSGGALSQYLRQGVTTIVAGNCGISPSVPGLASFYNGLAGKQGPNYVGMIGHNELRSNVGLSGTTPTPTQMQNMKNYIASGMDAGAFGFSTGLIYYSGFNSTTDEVVELATVVAEHGGVYTTHMRSESDEVLAAVAEALEIGERSGARVQISHVKCAGPSVWGLSDEYMALVNTAVAQGQDVWLDQYPYTASQTSINVLIPDWAENNWSDAVTNHRAELEQGVRDLIAGRGGADRVFIISGTYANRWLNEVASTLGKDAEDVIIDNIGINGANAIYHTMQEDDVRAFMVHPRLMMGSDGPTSSHPRGQGTFPRLWGTYGRDLGFFSHKECVQKTSTLAARQFRLMQQDRGRIDTGWYADIAVIDPATIVDRATFSQPTLSPLGISHVLVNGTVVVSGGTYTGALPGKVLRSYDSRTTGLSGWFLY